NCFWLQKQRTDSLLNSIAAQLRGVVERRSAFAQRQRRIHLANGVFSFENGGSLLPFSPNLLSRNRSPIAFDENAKGERFLDELVRPAVHPEDVVLIQKYGGLSLLGVNLIQRILILAGESPRGKNKLANVIQGVVGRENVTQLRTKWLNERFETYRFLKKTLLIGVDVEPDFLSTKGGAGLKGLVGGVGSMQKKSLERDRFRCRAIFVWSLHRTLGCVSACMAMSPRGDADCGSCATKRRHRKRSSQILVRCWCVKKVQGF